MISNCYTIYSVSFKILTVLDIQVNYCFFFIVNIFRLVFYGNYVLFNLVHI